MVNKLQSLHSYIEKKDILRENIYICGSSILALHGIRQNSDLEFFQVKNNKGIVKFPKVIWSQKVVDKDLEIFQNFYAFCGLSDKAIYKNKLYEERDGYNYVSLEVEYLYKEELCSLLHRKKDQEDVELMLEYDPDVKKRANDISKKYSNRLLKLVSKIYFKVLVCLKIFKMKFKNM